MKHSSKLVSLFGEAQARASRGGLRSALSFLRSKLASRTETVLYRRKTNAPGEALLRVNDLRIDRVDDEKQFDRVVPPDVDPGFERSNFARGGVCYVASVGSQPVGVGWVFRSSQLLSRMGQPSTSVYAGGFHVLEGFRGRGIYPALLDEICRAFVKPGVDVFAEISETNTASRKGLEKAGFSPLGILRTWTVVGFIWRWTLSPVGNQESGGRSQESGDRGQGSEDGRRTTDDGEENEDSRSRNDAGCA